jgi:hypothetical protein
MPMKFAVGVAGYRENMETNLPSGGIQQLVVLGLQARQD